MAADLSQVVGHELDPKPVSWNQRDLLTYAVGVGAKAEDLNIAYELHKSFAPLPTYPVVLPFKGDSPELNNFAKTLYAKPIPSMPPVDPNRGVHGSQSIEILKDLPLVSGPGWTWTTKYVGVAENKSGIVVTTENTLLDPKGVAYAKLYSASFNLGAKALGKPFSKYVAGPPQSKPIPTDRPADYVFADQTTSEQALIYRLSGDYNPLHIDPAVGKGTGFGGVILHGLSTFGFGARALIQTAGGNDPRSLRLFGVRFTSPVKPGDRLETSAWEVGKGPNGTVELAFQTRNLTSGKVVLGGGVAFVRKLITKL
ncbi:Peroxisomal dehydratase [Mycena indigotica]|uniref:Peroxisomal dehydratase n=1 Tax=Mycena indigotica TaxID=2126181 RepID=A0A8H6SD71_9AGAR|nr:Peroxisomal dehydratase [Mycena indigotica]KAF7296783.1 Peroxisomal dehydratase [Mycena indigotica]